MGMSVFVFFVSVSGPFEDGAEVAVQRSAHLAAPGAGREHDAVDQAADGGSGFVAFARVVQGVCETRDLAPVNAGDVRVDVGDVGGNVRKAVGPRYSFLGIYRSRIKEPETREPIYGICWTKAAVEAV